MTCVYTLQVSMTAMVVTESLLFMPARKLDEATVKLHDSLQKFAWWVGGVDGCEREGR